jgi:membrane fusion protein, heavy metal efflux system
MLFTLLPLLAAGLAGEPPEQRDTVRLAPETVDRLGVKVEPARSASHPGSLVLDGTLALDPERVARARPRFHGVVVAVGTTEDGPGQTRPIRPGDTVKPGQVLAVVWSSELSEKKNELLDALLRLRMEKETHKRLEGLRRDRVISAQSYEDAKHELESAEIAVAHAERSLRARGATAEEIKAVEAEADRVRMSNQRSPFDPEHSWARFIVRSPIEGKVIEANVAIDDLVEPDESLVVLADLRRLTVRVKVPEAELPAIDAAPSPLRWALRPKFHPEAAPMGGIIEGIGVMIDPADHTATLSGHVDNRDGRLRPGQTIVATIDLPPDADLVEVPEPSRLRSGGHDWVFVQPDPDEPTYRLRPVHVERVTPGFLMICNDSAEGLRPGERVVVAGAARLKAALDGAGPHDVSQR